MSETKDYGDIYTLATYLFISRQVNQSLLYKTYKTNDLPFKVQAFSLTDFAKRCEQRVYFATKITLFKMPPQQLTIKQRDMFSIEAIITDLSLKGLCIKLKKGLLSSELAPVYIWFCELEQAQNSPQDFMMGYRILSGEDKGDFSYFRLSLIPQQPAQSEFSHILHTLI